MSRGRRYKGPTNDGVTHGLSPAYVFPRRFIGRCIARGGGHETLLRDPCPYCGEPSTTVEHVIPRSLGGPSHYGNKVGACAPCNNTRQSTPFLVWMAQGKHRHGIRRKQWGYPKRG